MNRETIIQQAIRLLSRGPFRLFRNNAGALPDGRGGWVRYGLATGSSDLIGWRSVTITPEMVGATIAQFVALEVKTPTGRPTNEQRAFLAAVHRAGGVAAIVRSPEAANEVLSAPVLPPDAP